MQALIFNSGLGSRLGKLTADRPKSMVQLSNGETIFHRQLRVLASVGVREFVVTTGPFPQMLEETSREFEAMGCSFRFVNNPIYDQTNYIYSMWLARDLLRGNETLVLHGDLVFNASYIEGLLALPAGSYGSVDPALPLPDKDFKARVLDGEVHEVGVNTWGEDCVAFQAMYRLSVEAMDAWLDEVDSFIARGETGVYAENAANQVFESMHVMAHAYTGHVLEEIDTPEDLERVSAMIRAKDYASQPVYELAESGSVLLEGTPAGYALRGPRLGSVIGDCDLTRPLVVADGFLSRETLGGILGEGNWPVFSGYTPNPTYEQVLAGVRAFREGGCDSIVSVGGGSAIDVAKCIKLWATLPGDGSGDGAENPRFCDMPAVYSGILHIAVPSTAGTGSESTHFAVVYVDGEKRSVATDCIQPDIAVLVPGLLTGLPEYQRKATMLDAMCQAIESHWSVVSSEESRGYSSRAITLVTACWKAYLAGDVEAAREMHRAANLAGKAINLTTTTLAHAMSYKLTSLYGVAHGHAVAMCMPYAWRVLLERGDAETQKRLGEIDALTAGSNVPFGTGLEVFNRVLAQLALDVPAAKAEDLDVLAVSVNPQRMSNYPVALTVDELREAYREILGL
ncbi:MAG: iron-containing alcohol dehydrogenase [Atopobiaceae bacterium]|nr:iron-containing alcohol dehydrogenase [Atopobiaceae bacterium]